MRSMHSVDYGQRVNEQKLNKCKVNKARRDRLKSAGLCINGGKHGTATHGQLCLTCRLNHRK